MRKTAKYLAIFMVVLLALTACNAKENATATSQSANAAETTSAENANFNTPGVLPLFKETETLTVGIQSGISEDMDNNHYTKLLEEKANADLKFEFIGGTSADFVQKLSLMVASNSTLPDVIVGGLQLQESNKYGALGTFIPLNEYYEKSSHFIKEYLDKGDRELLPYITAADGNIYGIFGQTVEVGNYHMYRAWINKTWLDKLGLQMPVTTEDFYNVLNAFKTQDPNGNGKTDEIPMIGANRWNRMPFEFLMNPFTYVSAGGANNVPYLQLQDGKIVASYTLPEWKEGLEFQRRLVADGLLSALTFTQSDAELKQILENEDSQLVGVVPTNSMSVYMTDSVRKQDFVPLPPLTGPKGASFATKVTLLPNNSYFITKDCKNPEVAFRIGDLMWDKDLSITSRFGKEDVHWKKYVGSEKSLYDSMGIPATLHIIENIWGQPGHNAHWNENQPARRTFDMTVMAQVFDGNIYDSQYMTAVSVPYYMDKTPEKIVDYIIFTEEEWRAIADIANSINTYVNESKTRFLVGDLSLTEWDNYVKEFDKMGLQDYLKICQIAYDRMMK